MAFSPVIEYLVAHNGLLIDDVEAVRATAPEQSAEMALVRQGIVTEDVLLAAMEAVFRVPAVLCYRETLDPEVKAILSEDLSYRLQVLPLRCEGNVLVLAMVDPDDVVAEDLVRFSTGWETRRMVTLEDDLKQAQRKLYRPGAEAAEEHYQPFDFSTTMQEMHVTDVEAEPEDSSDDRAANATPVVRAVDDIVANAVGMRASDIHMEPLANAFRVRYRIDGVLREVCQFPKHVQRMVTSRIKIIAGMDISERRRPQDGRIHVRLPSHVIDLRVSTLPTFHGEKIVMRILDSKKALVEIESMGMASYDYEAFLEFIRQPQGMLIITGPTGSGKTSTLYAALNRIHTPDTNIITVEDPIEYQLAGVNQVQINDRAGLTFPAALRAILRQDPNVVMLGEVRDLETAEIAFQAAMTGHMVLSTLHTNDAPSTVSRLIHLGLPRYLVASCLLGVMAQRLVRRLCTNCRHPAAPSASLLEVVRRSGVRNLPTTYYTGPGCKKCSHSGYSGRVGIFEILRMTEQIRALVYAEASEQEMRKMARHQGMRTLLEDALRKVADGETSLEEALRVAPAGAEVAGEAEEESPASFVSPKEIQPSVNGFSPSPAASRVAPKKHSGGSRMTSKKPAVRTNTSARLLATDDGSEERALVWRALEKANYVVEMVAPGERVLKRALDWCPDLILADLAMPGLDGLSLCRRLRSEAATQDTAIVLIVDPHDAANEIAALRFGADACVHRPLQVDFLLAHIESALRRVRGRAADAVESPLL